MKAILFDLDGTLLSMDFRKFFPAYMKELGAYLSGLFDVANLEEDITASVYAAIEDTNASTTVQSVFKREFTRRRGCTWEECKPWLDRFYDERFDSLRYLADDAPEMPQIVGLLKQKGYKLAVATNPVFPRAALESRIRWAGLDPEDFEFIADYETMHYCKPHLRYYREILDRIDMYAEDCIMIGNNAVEDMVPRKLGMPTYFVTDEAIYNDVTPDCDWKGSRKELLELVKEMPSCK